MRRGDLPKRSTRSTPASFSPTTARRRSTGRRNSTTRSIAAFREQLNAMGYKFQFMTLAGFHALNHSFFALAHDFKTRGMTAYAEFQAQEFASEAHGYTATRHQREVGTGYFDEVASVIGEGQTSTTALAGSTESEQFYETAKGARASTHERRARRLRHRTRSAGRIRRLLSAAAQAIHARSSKRWLAARKARLARAHAGELPEYLPPSEATTGSLADRTCRHGAPTSATK